MDAFHWIAVVLSTVLGLGVARILAGFVSVFRARGRVRPDWLPLLLAGAVLGRLLQFWWALAELSGVRYWSLSSFLLLTAMIILLFLAAALIVPAEQDMHSPRAAFERDGRWAMMSLAIYHLLCVFVNWWLFGHVRLDVTANLIALAVLAALIAIVPNRRLHEGMGVTYVLLSIVETAIASQSAYGR